MNNGSGGNGVSCGGICDSAAGDGATASPPAPGCARSSATSEDTLPLPRGVSYCCATVVGALTVATTRHFVCAATNPDADYVPDIANSRLADVGSKPGAPATTGSRLSVACSWGISVRLYVHGSRTHGHGVLAHKWMRVTPVQEPLKHCTQPNVPRLSVRLRLGNLVQ